MNDRHIRWQEQGGSLKNKEILDNFKRIKLLHFKLGFSYDALHAVETLMNCRNKSWISKVYYEIHMATISVYLLDFFLLGQQNESAFRQEVAPSSRQSRSMHEQIWK